MAELCDYLRVLDLPGVAPPEFGTLDAEVHDHGTYIQREQHGRMVAKVDESGWRNRGFRLSQWRLHLLIDLEPTHHRATCYETTRPQHLTTDVLALAMLWLGSAAVN